MLTTIKDNRPLPLSLSKDDLHLPPRIIHKFALTVDLNKISDIRSFISHLNSNEPAKTKPPLHIRGGSKKWSETLHAIYIYYRIFDEDGRKAYNKDLIQLSTSRRKIYENNIHHLHRNRIFTDGRETLINLRQVRIHPYALPCTNNTTNNDEIDILDGTPCPYCKFLLTKPIRKTEEYQKLRNKNPTVKCINCLIGYQQGLKQVRKNNLLNELIQEQLLAPVEFDTLQYNNHDPNITSFLEEEFGEELSLLLAPLVPMRLKVCCITVPTYRPGAKYSRNALLGAQCRVEDLNSHPNAISDQGHFSATVIKFPPNKAGKEDFLVAINDKGYDNDDLEQYRKEDEIIIENGNIEFRTGSSAGVTQLEDRCTQQTCAEGNTSLRFSTETGAALQTLYTNKQGKVVKLGGTTGVRSRPGLHLQGKVKEDYSISRSYYRRMILKEILTYIKSMACLKACGIQPYDGGQFYLSDLKTLLHNNMQKLEEKEGIENVLIEYILKFIEYRNHSAVTCHVDGVSIEILSVIDRLGYNTKHAYLFFPLNNIVYEFAVNESITVASLSNTLHVADPSRGHSSSSGGSGGNTSRVSWRT